MTKERNAFVTGGEKAGHFAFLRVMFEKDTNTQQQPGLVSRQIIVSSLQVRFFRFVARSIGKEFTLFNLVCLLPIEKREEFWHERKLLSKEEEEEKKNSSSSHVHLSG